MRVGLGHGTVALVAAAALAAGGCAAIGGEVIDALDLSSGGPKGMGAPVELVSGEVGGHTWALEAATSAEGPVVLTVLDGERHATSWGWAVELTDDAPISTSAGIPHAIGDDIDSPLIDLVLGYSIVHSSIDEVLVLRGHEVVGRYEPVPHPWAEFSVAAVAAGGTDAREPYLVIACRGGEQASYAVAYSSGQSGWELPPEDPC